MTAAQFYATLLHLYPRSFRDEFGVEMERAFHVLHQEHGAGWRLWTIVAFDLIHSLRTAHFAELRDRARRPGSRRLMTMAIGVGVTIAASKALAWLYRYSYHPYLEGVQVTPPVLGVIHGGVLGLAVAVAQRVLLDGVRHPLRSWAMMSTIALPVSALFSLAVLDRVLLGLNPIVGNPMSDRFSRAVAQLHASRTWTDLVIQFGLMLTTALLVQVVAERASMVRRGAH